MGFFDAPTWQAPPGLGGYLSAAQNMAGADQSAPWEHASNKWLNHLFQGGAKGQQAMNSPYLQAFENPVFNAYGTALRDVNEQAGRRAGLATGPQLGLLNAQNDMARTDLSDREGSAIQDAFGRAIGSAQSAGQAGMNRTLQGQQMGMQDWLGGFGQYRREVKPGILSRIGQIGDIGAGIAGSFFGMGGLAAGGPGSGQWAGLGPSGGAYGT